MCANRFSTTFQSKSIRTEIIWRRKRHHEYEIAIEAARESAVKHMSVIEKVLGPILKWIGYAGDILECATAIALLYDFLERAMHAKSDEALKEAGAVFSKAVVAMGLVVLFRFLEWSADSRAVEEVKQLESGVDLVIGKYDEIKNIVTTTGTGTSGSEILRKSLKETGIITPPYPNAVHHIVARGASKAKESVVILEKYGIDIDSAANGVFLPYRKNEYVTTEAIRAYA